MRLLTPKRLAENEDFIWSLADAQIDEFLPTGRCEVVRELGGPFTMLVIADLLGVPEADHAWFIEAMGQRGGGHVGAAGGSTMAKTPLEVLYDRFVEYLEDRRREPKGDVLTGLATATFADGSIPEASDVAKIASNLFAAGQETTIRLLGTAFLRVAEDADLQQRLRDDHTLIPNFIEECLRHESPVKGDFRLNRVTTTVGGVELPAGTTVMVLNGAANRDPRKFEDPNTFSIERAERPGAPRVRPRRSTSAPAPPWPAPRAGWRSSGCWSARAPSASTRPSTARPTTAATSTPRPSSSGASRSCTWSSRPRADRGPGIAQRRPGARSSTPPWACSPSTA